MSDPDSRNLNELRLKTGISLSQARFALANFCLTHFGAKGQYFADMLDLCVEVNQFQEMLRVIRDEVRGRCPDRFPALLTCVREANDGGEMSFAPQATPSSVIVPAPETPKRTGRAVSTGNQPAGPANATHPAAAPALQPLQDAESELPRVAAGVSLAQARFVLAEFCLDEFGARGQPFIDATDRCADIAAVQSLVSVIGAEVRERYRDSLPKLIDCLREINATGD